MTKPRIIFRDPGGGGRQLVLSDIGTRWCMDLLFPSHIGTVVAKLENSGKSHSLAFVRACSLPCVDEGVASADDAMMQRCPAHIPHASLSHNLSSFSFCVCGERICVWVSHPNPEGRRTIGDQEHEPSPLVLTPTPHVHPEVGHCSAADLTHATASSLHRKELSLAGTFG